VTVKIAIETWAPEYGSPVDGEVVRPTSEAVVDAEVEQARDDWRPLDPEALDGGGPVLYFIDGVRRIDARVWLMDDEAPARPGACATFAAGAVRCSERAEVVTTRVERRLIARAGPPPLETTAGVFVPRPVVEDDIDSLFTALQTDMRSMEARIAQELELAEDAVVVFDGPLGDGRDVRPAIGYIKSHRVSYLDEELSRVVAQLRPGQRTPMFLIGERFARFTWYLRLPGPDGGPWSGVVRCECIADEAVESAVRLANLSAAVLPRFASVPFKDPRAPQNLYPIAELERELRRRMGDPAYVERCLRSAAVGWGA
jgi:hypothetical protein